MELTMIKFKKLIKITEIRKMMDLPISIRHEDCYFNLITK
jgi:hypothetical protein